MRSQSFKNPCELFYVFFGGTQADDNVINVDTAGHSYEVLQDLIHHFLKPDWRVFPPELQPAVLVYVE